MSYAQNLMSLGIPPKNIRFNRKNKKSRVVASTGHPRSQAVDKSGLSRSPDAELVIRTADSPDG